MTKTQQAETTVATTKRDAVLVGALRNARVALVDDAAIMAKFEFQAQGQDGSWFNVVSLLRHGQMAPDFSSAEPRVLVGAMGPDRLFEAAGIFELISGEMAID